MPSLFRLQDFQRLDAGGSGSLTSRHKHLFPGSGSQVDREIAYLKTKGATTGTRGDRWRKYLSVPVKATIQSAIRKLVSLP